MITYINVLRVIAGFFVVLLHVSGDGFDIKTGSFAVGEPNWWVANGYNSITRWTVPIFVMIGGALAIRSKNGVFGVYLFRRSKRVLIPLAFWSLIYLGYRLGFKELSIKQAFYHLFYSGKPYYHMWYFYMLLGLTIMTPVLSTIRDRYGVRSLGIIGLISLLLFLKVPLLTEFFPLVQITSTPDYLVWFMPYLGYYCLGSYFSSVSPKISNMSIIILLLLLFTITILGTFKEGRIFHSYLAWNTAIISILIFILFKKLRFGSRITKLSSRLAPLTLGVYLIHPLLLDLISDMGISIETIRPIYAIPLIVLCSWVICLAITRIFILNKQLAKVVQ